MGDGGFPFFLQVGLIFWWGERKSPTVRRPEGGLTMVLAPDSRAQIPGLENPRLFALPSREGFSGLAWMRSAGIPYDLDKWEGPTNLLALPAEQLGSLFSTLVRSNFSRPFDLVGESEPDLDDVSLFSIAEGKSRLRVAGDLVGRPLLRSVELRSQTGASILKNSEVQVSVEPDGTVFSAALVSGSGSKEADLYALNVARSLCFEPTRSDGLSSSAKMEGVTWGKLIFEWYTVALAGTNIVNAGP